MINFLDVIYKNIHHKLASVSYLGGIDIIIFKKILEISEKLEFLKFSLKVYKKYSCR